MVRCKKKRRRDDPVSFSTPSYLAWLLGKLDPVGAVHLAGQTALDVDVVGAGGEAGGLPVELPGVGQAVVLKPAGAGIIERDGVSGVDSIAHLVDHHARLGSSTGEDGNGAVGVLPLQRNGVVIVYIPEPLLKLNMCLGIFLYIFRYISASDCRSFKYIAPGKGRRRFMSGSCYRREVTQVPTPGNFPIVPR